MLARIILLIGYFFIYCVSALPANFNTVELKNLNQIQSKDDLKGFKDRNYFNKNRNQNFNTVDLKELNQINSKDDLKGFKDSSYFNKNKKSKNFEALFEEFTNIEKRAFGLKVSTLAQMAGAPQDLIEKIKKVEAQYEAEGKTLTLLDAADIAESHGFSKEIVDQIRALGGMMGGGSSNGSSKTTTSKKPAIQIPTGINIPTNLLPKPTTTTTKKQEPTTTTHHHTTTTTTHHHTTTTTKKQEPTTTTHHHTTTTTHHHTTTTTHHHTTTTTHHHTTTTTTHHHTTTTTKKQEPTTTTHHHTTTSSKPKTTTTKSSSQTSLSSLAKEKGAPDSIVSKIKALEASYAMLGKTLTIDDLISLAKQAGISEENIQLVKSIIGGGSSTKPTTSKDKPAATTTKEKTIAKTTEKATTTKSQKTTTAKSEPTKTPAHQSIADLAAANGAPSFVVEKARQLEKEYAAQGKVLTLDEVIRLAENYGLPEDMIQQVRDVAKNNDIPIDEKKPTTSKITGNNDKTVKVNEPTKTVQKPTTSSKNGPTNSTPSKQQSMSELAAANGAPSYLVEKVKQLEKEYAAKGKVLTFDEVIRLAKERGIPDEIIDQVKEIYKNGNNSSSNFSNVTDTKKNPLTGSDKENVGKVNDALDEIIAKTNAGAKTPITTKNGKKPSMAEIAEANGAPPYLVAKAREMEKEYAAKGKELTIDEVVRLAKERGVPDSLIDEIKRVYSESIKQAEAGKAPKSSNPPSIPSDLSLNQSATNSTAVNGAKGNQANDKPSTFNNISISELAALMGVSDKMVEKAKQFEAMAAAEGKPITVADLCNIAEALGYPHDMIQKIRDADAKVQAEGRVMTLSELADAAEAAGVNPEKVAKLRQIIKERNLDGTFTTNGLLPTNNSTLANNGTLATPPNKNSTVPLTDAKVKDKSAEEGGFNYWILIGIIAAVIVIIIAVVLCCRGKK